MEMAGQSGESGREGRGRRGDGMEAIDRKGRG